MPTHDSQGQGAATSVTSQSTGSFTIASNSDRFLFCTVVIMANPGASGVTLTSVNWNTSEAFTLIGSMQQDGRIFFQDAYLLAPTATTSTVDVVIDPGDATTTDMHVHAAACYDAEQAAPTHAYAPNAVQATVASDTDELCYSGMGCRAGDPTPDDTATTSLTTLRGGGNESNAQISRAAGASPNQTLSWSSVGADDRVVSAVSIAPAAVAAIQPIFEFRVPVAA